MPPPSPADGADRPGQPIRSGGEQDPGQRNDGDRGDQSSDMSHTAHGSVLIMKRLPGQIPFVHIDDPVFG
jgi:hypothetical protein